MFANRKWFRTSRRTILPNPKTREGWLFYLAALLVICVPTLGLLFRFQFFPEAVIWITASSLMFVLEIRALKREIAKWEARRDLFYISDVPVNQK